MGNYLVSIQPYSDPDTDTIIKGNNVQTAAVFAVIVVWIHL